jgi:hypothetical protein
MTISLVQSVTNAADIDQLKEVVRAIIGERCWRAQLSYGDELTLHFGAKIPYLQRSMAGQFKGALILGTRATAWMLDCDQELWVTSADSLDVIRDRIQAIANTTVTGFELTSPDLGLQVTFDNHYRLTLLPKKEEEHDLPHWEVFFPDQTTIKVG